MRRGSADSWTYIIHSNGISGEGVGLVRGDRHAEEQREMRTLGCTMAGQYLQARVEATILLAAWVGKGRLRRCVVLLLEVEDDLVSGLRGLAQATSEHGDQVRAEQKAAYYRFWRECKGTSRATDLNVVNGCVNCSGGSQNERECGEEHLYQRRYEELTKSSE